MAHPEDVAPVVAEFLETADLYQRVRFGDPEGDEGYRRKWRVDEFALPGRLRVRLSCPTCDLDVCTFALDVGERETTRYLKTGSSHTIVFTCTHCDAQKRWFLVWVESSAEGDAFVLQKAGEWPQSRRTEPALRQALGDSLPLYERGVESRARGAGIAAVTYFRRVVEAQVARLMGDLREYADATAARELLEALDQAATAFSAAKRLELIKDQLPPALRPGSHNPLETLYGAFSEAVHELSDEESVEVADNLRDSLAFIVRTLAHFKADAEAFKRTTDRQMNKIAMRAQKEKKTPPAGTTGSP